jgi:arsenate reductase
MSERARVLILCTGNSARSQMAEAALRHFGGNSFDVASAGVSPSQIRPEAVQVMEEIGIPVINQYSKSVDVFSGERFDYIITVCDNAKESCPVFPGNATRIHWSFDDPAAVEGTAAEKLEAFRRVRDEVVERIVAFSQALPPP